MLFSLNIILALIKGTLLLLLTKILEIICIFGLICQVSKVKILEKIYFLRSLTATFSGKIEFSVVSDSGEKVFRKKKSIKVYFYSFFVKTKKCY